jgi:ubiquinone/menaquinone biosynthesis C-methylase UbiE
VKRLLAAGAGALLAAALWWRRHPSPCPYGQRFWLAPPHPFITRARLLESLAPQPGERLLEVGPGTGYYSLTVAQAAGGLDIFDLQPEMLDHTMRAAEQKGVTNLRPSQGDARDLPYADDTFDGAYLVAVLGEIPEPEAALAQLRRVVKPGGRVVVGELFGDPHMVGERRLRRLAAEAGLTFERRVGPPFGFFAVLRA